MRGLDGCRNDGVNVFCTPPLNEPCPDAQFHQPRARLDLTASVAAKADAQWSPPLLRWQGMLGASLIAAVGATVFFRRR